MKNYVTSSSFSLGIIGGGQLGRMLAQAASNWDVRLHCLDQNESAPARIFCHEFSKGSMTSYDDVVAFGKNVDVVTVESDNVNVEALAYLEQQGKTVYPSSKTLKIIQDKGLQRNFCKDKGLPIPRYDLFDTKEDLASAVVEGVWEAPFIVKTRSAGYDGKGVFLVKDQTDIENLPSKDLLVEEAVDIDKELSLIAVRNASGQIRVYPPIELVMSEDAYLVDYLISPAKVSDDIAKKTLEIAHDLTESLDVKGLLAIEMFIDKKGEILINECSPRPHNSGHHTIEAAISSQYEQHLRGILNLPLGSTEMKMPSAMVNLLGDENSSGPVCYEGLDECLKIAGVYVYIYGKAETKPMRKMGHVTILNESSDKLEAIVKEIKEKVKVTSWDK